MAAYESEFETLLDHLKVVVDDIEQVHTVKQMIYKLKADIIDLLRIVVTHAELDTVELPPSAYGEFPKLKGKTVESAVLDRSGVILIRLKEGEVKLHDLSEYQPEAVIRIFNIVMPILRKAVAEQRKIHERHLEALQTIKESLTGLEKRRKV
ncbi:MAG: hypothetical protein QXJ75_05195 [Candidatus Bathyarchaeia archaeon]